MSFNAPVAQTRIVIKRLNFYGTREYHQQFTTPWESNIRDTHALDTLIEATHNSTHIDPTALSGMTDLIVTPSTENATEAPIQDGWRHRRLMFHALIEVESSFTNASSVQYVSGYTDFDGVSDSGAVAPDMQLYFNTSMLFRKVMRGDGSMSLRMVENTNLLGNYRAPTSYHGRYDPASHHLRPMDLASTLYTQSVMEDDEYANTVDISTSSAVGLTKSRAANNHAPTYLSRVLQAFKTKEQEQSTWNATEAETYSSLISHTAEPLINRDSFLRSLTIDHDYGKFDNVSISFGRLAETHPELRVQGVVNVGKLTYQETKNSIGFENTDSLHGNTLEQQSGVVIASSLPAIISEAMFVGFGFDMTNDTRDGTLIVTPRAEWINSFTQGVDPKPMVDMVVGRIHRELAPMITNRGLFTVNASVKMNLVGDAWMRISVNGNPPMIFSIPIWGNSLFVPVVGSSEQNLRNLSSDLDNLARGADEARRANMPQFDPRDFNMGGTARDFQPEEEYYPQRGFVDPVPPNPSVDIPASGGIGLGTLPHLNVN